MQLRKRVLVLLCGSVLGTLQWGRNFAVAETGSRHHRDQVVGGCFNGAATLQLRKLSHSMPCSRHHGLLQWGRNFAVAETSLEDRLAASKPGQLQWGRNFAVAETCAGGLLPVPLHNASMGPQLCSCGNVRLKSIPSAIHIASMGPQLCSCGNRHHQPEQPVRDGASMGPQLCSCGNHTDHERRWAAAVGFNGAATLQLRKRGFFSRAGFLRHRFNGAATLQLRKLDHPAGHVIDPLVASMGPQLCSCGNKNPYSGCQEPSSMLQWGRNFAVAETQA